MKFEGIYPQMYEMDLSNMLYVLLLETKSDKGRVRT